MLAARKLARTCQQVSTSIRSISGRGPAGISLGESLSRELNEDSEATAQQVAAALKPAHRQALLAALSASENQASQASVSR